MDTMDTMEHLETDGGESSKKALKLATKPTKLNTGCTLLVNSVMLIFFSLYAFHNPDDSECYVTCAKGEYNIFDTDCLVYPNYIGGAEAVNVKW